MTLLVIYPHRCSAELLKELGVTPADPEKAPFTVHIEVKDAKLLEKVRSTKGAISQVIDGSEQPGAISAAKKAAKGKAKTVETVDADEVPLAKK